MITNDRLIPKPNGSIYNEINRFPDETDPYLKPRMSNIQLYVQYKRKMQILYDFLSVDPRFSDINSISFFPTKFKLE